MLKTRTHEPSIIGDALSLGSCGVHSIDAVLCGVCVCVKGETGEGRGRAGWRGEGVSVEEGERRGGEAVEGRGGWKEEKE